MKKKQEEKIQIIFEGDYQPHMGTFTIEITEFLKKQGCFIVESNPVRGIIRIDRSKTCLEWAP